MISGGTSDPWRITNEERAKHDQEFLQLNPINGFVTGDQAKSLFLQSGLPPAILGHIWSLADMNADGKMDRHEFSIAMHLIHLKLKGIELPKVLPPVLKNPPAPTMGTFGAAMGLGGIRPIMSTNPGNVAGPRPVITNGSILMGHGNFGASNAGLTGAGSIQGVTPINQGVGTVSATPPVPLDTKPRSASNTSQDSSSGTLIEWAVPHQAKLRYTQTFNTHDRTRTGFLSGNQARNILLQSGLPHPVLALIWTLSDIDSDGRLTCEEFCVAMHLSDMSKAGDPLPTKLPIELIPPSYRRRRTSSVQSVGGSPAASVGQISQTVDLVIDDKQFGLATFEDKRKMNFEKGQAELEKRRQALLESQRREQEARERKEREEQEKRERIRQEQERRRQMELEKQLAKQREIEQEKEEQRRKVMEQREAARREMERQRQLEWERQRRQDLMSQRQKEQETVCHLKAKNKNLTYDLEKLNEKMNELNATISDTRNGVSEIKSEIDSMKGQRDKKVTLINSIKLQLKEHNDKMLLLNQEKVNLESKLKSSSNCSNPTSESMNIVMHSFNNKQITLDQLRDVLSNIEKSTAQKLQDIEGNNSQLKDAKNELTDLIRKTNALRKTLEQKRNDGSKLKTKEESKNSNLVDTTYSESEDVFKSGEMNLTASNDKQSSPTSNAELTETNEEIVADTTPFGKQNTSTSLFDGNVNTVGTNDDLFGGNDSNIFANGTVFGSSEAELFSADGGMSPFDDNKDVFADSDSKLFTKDNVFADRIDIFSREDIFEDNSNIFGNDADVFGGNADIFGSGANAFSFEAKNFNAAVENAETFGNVANVFGDGAAPDFTSNSGGLFDQINDVGRTKVGSNGNVAKSSSDSATAATSLFDGSSAIFTSNDVFGGESEVNSSFSAWNDDSFFHSSSVDNTSSSSPPTQTAVARTPEEENRLLKYRVLYAFEARNEDELSIMPGDIVMVPEKQDAEPGWLGGELKGRTGWFPSAYAELVDNSTTSDDAVQATSAPIAINIDGGLSSPVGGGIEETVHIVGTEMKMTLSGISEAPEGNGDAVSIGGGSEVANDAGNNTNVSPDVVYDDDASNDVIQHSEQSSFVNVTKTGQGAVLTESTSPIPGQGEEVEGLQAQALFPWRAKKENHLTFNKDDVINVKEQQDMWWYGDCDNKVGWFPKSYVKLIAGPRKNEDSSGIVSSQSDEYVNSNVNDSNDYYMAMYAYQSNEIGDLTFNQGDIILVTKMDGDWWTGIIGADRCGIFPSNYVQKVDAKPTEDEGLEQPDQPQPEAETESTNANTVHVEHQAAASRVRKPEIATVIAPYTATGSEQLTLQRGQLIQVRKRSPSGWWEGELQAKGKQRQIGWFPASYVKLLSSAGSTPNTSARSTPDITRNCNDSGITSSPSQEQVCVLFSYEAQNSDEMSLAKGDIITVINKDDPSWWKGASQNGVSGLFPANYVQPVVDRNQSPTINEWMLNSNVFMNLDSIERKRQISIHELIDTEQSYMEDMSIVLDVFYKPLKKSCVLSENELQVVFVNWTELIMCNTKILKALRVRKKMSPDFVIDIIGDILCETIPMLTPYIRFCSCQLNAAALIQQKTERSPEFKSVAKKCARDKRAKGMPLSSFLLKPMQRITKYPLLIKKIMEFTPDNHPDHNNLVEALSQAQLKCNEVNEGVRERENSDRLEWLQTHVHCEGVMEKLTFNSVTNSLGPRKYLHSGTLTKVKSNKELMGFLVNDFLLLAQPMKPIPPTASVFLSEKATNSWYRMYKQPLCLNDVTIKQNSDGDDGTFQIVHCDRIYTVKTVNSNERNVWVKKLEEAITFYKETEKKKLEKQNSLKFQKTNGVGRLLVVVCEGIDLTPSSSNRDGRSDPYCELSMGSQEHKTKVVPGTLNPKWNASMQFLIKDLKRDVLCITVYDRDLFSPNDFLGRTEVRVADIYNETSKTRGPIVKILNLYEVDRGQVSIKVDLHLFEA